VEHVGHHIKAVLGLYSQTNVSRVVLLHDTHYVCLHIRTISVYAEVVRDHTLLDVDMAMIFCSSNSVFFLLLDRV
jgi:hypothetical protein